MTGSEDLKMLAALTRSLSEHLADLERATALFRVLVKDLDQERAEFGRVSVEHSLGVLKASEMMLLNTPLPSHSDIRSAAARLRRIAVRIENTRAAQDRPLGKPPP